MRPWLLLPPLLAAVVFGIPGVVAEATITAQAPTEPLPWDGPVTVNVTVKASCATVAQDNQAGVTELELAGSADAPWIVITGQKAPWTRDQCDTSTASQATTCSPQPACAANYPVATTKGILTLTPAADAPALTTATITVTAKGETGKTTFTTNVAYHGTLNATVAQPILAAGPGEELRFSLELDALTNGKSRIMFALKQEPVRGKLSGLPETVDVQPNVAYLMDHGGMMMWMDGVGAGQPERVTVPLTFKAPAEGFATENITLEAQLMSYDDASKVSAPVLGSWTFQPKEAASPAAKESAPGPDLGIIVLALGSLVAVRRRAR